MKKGLFKTIAVATIAVVAFAGAGCSKKDEAAKTTPPPMTPEQVKQKEEIKKGRDESKTIVVAKVNDAEVTMFDLVSEMNAIAPRYIKPGQPKAPGLDEKIKKEALDRAIIQELAVQEAAKQGITVKKELIDDVVKKFKESLGSDAAYKDYLKERGITEDVMRRQIDRDNLFQLITAKEIYQKISVADKTLKNEYQKNKGKLKLPERFVAEDIFFGAGKFDEATIKKAKDVLAEIRKSNNDISTLKPDSSFKISKEQVKPEYHPGLYAAMADLKAGDVSEVMRDIDGIHIVKVVSNDPPRQMSFEDAKPIMEKKLKAELGDKKMLSWGNELRKKATVEILLPKVEKKMKEEAEKKQ